MTIRLFSWVLLVMAAIVFAATTVFADPVSEVERNLPDGREIVLPPR